MSPRQWIGSAAPRSSAAEILDQGREKKGTGGFFRSAGQKPSRPLLPAAEILDQADASLLDLIDNLLNKGVVLNGELVLALADVDLIYLRLSVLFCAADRVFDLPHEHHRRRRS